MLTALCALSLTLQTRPFDFQGLGPYDSKIPTPAAVLGYGPGERHTTFHDQERVVEAIRQQATDRMRVIEYGKSTEGRRLRLAIIGSTANMARLDQIKANTAAISSADPTVNLDKLIKDTPVVVWINETIHGDETASFESGMWLIYTLAASNNPAVTKALDNALVIVNPSYNPDGHERFVVWYNSVAIGSPNPAAFEQQQPDVMAGRTNHYRFDMNRDRVAFSQLESREEAAAVLSWHPQVYADQHGEVDGYFFPPCPMSINVNVGRERYDKWTHIFGKANAEAFDRNGWLYFVGKEYDFYYPGYLDIFATLTGAIGMTHETNGGSQLAIENEAGGTITLREGMMKHFTTALTLIQSSADHREELLREYAQFKKNAVTGASAGSFKRVIVEGDPRALARLSAQLGFAGVTSTYLGKDLKQKATNYWTGKSEDRKFAAGSLVIDIAQEQGAYAKTALEPGSDFEPEFIKRQQAIIKDQQNKERYPRWPGIEFYDMTGWCMVFGHGLQAWWSSDVPPIATGSAAPAKGSAAYGKVGATIAYADRQDILAVYDLLARGVRVDLTNEPMTLGGKAVAKGSFLILREHNTAGDIETILQDVARARSVKIEPIESAWPDTGASGPTDSRTIRPPMISVVFGAGEGTTSFGGIWYALEQQFKLPFTPIFASSLDDPGKATCVICPGGSYEPPSDRLKAWVRQGGCLVALENPQWLLGEKGFQTLEMKRGTGLPGSLFRARLNPRSVFAAGYDPSASLAVPVAGGSFEKVRPEGGAVVSFDADEKVKKLLSGWEWDDTEAALAGTVWMHDIPFGSGHVIFFDQDPTDRALWPGLEKLLLNAILFGAG